MSVGRQIGLGENSKLISAKQLNKKHIEIVKGTKRAEKRQYKVVSSLRMLLPVAA